MLQVLEFLAVIAAAIFGLLLARSKQMDVVGVVCVTFIVAFGGGTLRDVDKALTHLASFAPDERVEVEGKEYVVAELRAQVERERVQGFAVPIGLGAVFFGLFVWARRAAVPALTTALLLFVTVHAVEAVIDPTTLPRGLFLKIFFLVGLVAGLKAALAQREAVLAAADPALT